MKNYILSLDQGTTSSRAIIFNHKAEIHSLVQKEFKQIYPQPGWVEHNPQDIWQSQLSAAREAIQKGKVDGGQITAIGITNQRETAILWEKSTGKPVYNAIVWQCRRTQEICQHLQQDGLTQTIRKKTGLLLDPYFSATKIMWLLDNIPGLRQRAQEGEIAFGTVDSWLLFKLTGQHLTDPSNASRTLLYNINQGNWDKELLKELKIPSAILPRIVKSSSEFAITKKQILGSPIPVCGVAGDQQAALFGQTCFQLGNAKNTYGTGCFTLMHTGNKPIYSKNNLLTTVAWDIGKGLEYALEGSVFIAGAVVQWLRDELKIIKQSAETEKLASSVADTGGAYFVPAFVGLGAPYWNSQVRGALLGLTRGSGRAHIVRAALESIAYQSKDLLDAMARDTGKQLTGLKVDGGAARNNFLMQFQADILGMAIQRPVVAETTALGAAYLAGLASGFWSDLTQIEEYWKLDREFKPKMDVQSRKEKLTGWQRAVETACGFMV